MSKVRYTEQFKRDAVRLVTEEGYSNKAAAEAVGVGHHSPTLASNTYHTQPLNNATSAIEHRLTALAPRNRRGGFPARFTTLPPTPLGGMPTLPAQACPPLAADTGQSETAQG